MSDLRTLAEAVKQWSNITEIRPATEDDPCIMGALDDGEFYPVVTIECEDYYVDSMPLARFYAAATPRRVIGLLDEIERLTIEAVAADIRIGNDAAVIAELTAERDALKAAVEEQRRIIETLNEGIGCETTLESATVLDERDALKSANRDLQDWYDAAHADAKRWKYSVAIGPNQVMNWLDVYDDWNGEDDFIEAINKAMKGEQS